MWHSGGAEEYAAAWLRDDSWERRPPAVVPFSPSERSWWGTSRGGKGHHAATRARAQDAGFPWLQAARVARAPGGCDGSLRPRLATPEPQGKAQPSSLPSRAPLLAFSPGRASEPKSAARFGAWRG